MGRRRPWPSPAASTASAASGAANEYMAYQFKYDSIHGRYPGTIEPTADGLLIDGVLTPTTHTRDPSEIPFGAMGAEYICESTGAFLTADKVAPHIAAGAKKIIFGPGQGRLPDRRHGRQRGDLRPLHGRRLLRVLHDQRPRAHGQGHQRQVRHR